MTKEAKILTSPTAGNIPPIGTVFKFKGSAIEYVVIENASVRTDLYDGPYDFHGITCIKFNDLMNNEPNPKEKMFYYSHSSMRMGEPMREYYVVTLITKPIIRKNTTVYSLGE